VAPKKQKAIPPVERPGISSPSEKTSTHLLHEITDTPGVDAALIVARDGFVIESAGSLGAIDLDTIGASVALSMNGAASVEKEIGLKAFQSFTWEASDALIMCTVAGDALLVVIAPDSRKIGKIRLNIKKHLPDLAEMF
jgi:predicted regulator of Ras-like GTPase activity (Roadblock/LC7/MglB family)